jgi:hypothetical protein
LFDRLIGFFVLLPLSNGGLIRWDESIAAFHKLRKLAGDFVSSHPPKYIAESSVAPGGRSYGTGLPVEPPPIFLKFETTKIHFCNV